jgi:DNA-binding MarR family transcriptional regulator
MVVVVVVLDRHLAPAGAHRGQQQGRPRPPGPSTCSLLCVRTQSNSPTEPDDEGIRAWAALLHVHAALVPMLDRELQRATGLPLAWYDLLLELNSAPERRLRMTDLGARVVLSRSRVSRLTDELVATGLVERFADPNDRRSSFAVITAAGRRRLASAAPVYLAGIQTHFTRHLSDRERRNVGDALWRVVEAESTA